MVGVEKCRRRAEEQVGKGEGGVACCKKRALPSSFSGWGGGGCSGA